MTARAVPPPLGPAERPPAPDLADAAGLILLRQLRRAATGRRAVIAVVAAALPLLLTAAVREPDPGILTEVVSGALVSFLLPLVALSFGSGLLYDEAEEGTLTYLFTTPIPRPALLLGKWAAALAVGWAVLLLSLGGMLLVTPADLGPLRPFIRASVVGILLGYPAYLGIFGLLGTLFRRGFIAGLVYAFGFELVPTLVPGIIRFVSMRFFVNSLIAPSAPNRAAFSGGFFDFRPCGGTAALATLLVTALASLAISLLACRRKEFQARNVQA